MQTIQPDNKQHWLELRNQDITSTEIGALFGISPYITEFELWYRKKENQIVELEDNDRMFWGRTLESAIAQGVAEKNGWQVRKMDEYIRDENLRIGSSFDYSIESMIKVVDGEGNELTKSKEYALEDSDPFIGILEIKNVDSLAYKRTWEDDEPPLHIQIQVQHQLLVSGREYAYLACLVGGNDLKLIRIDKNEKVHDGIKKRVAKFWKSIEDNQPPSPDFSRDSEVIAQMYGYAEPGKFKDATGDSEFLELVREYFNASNEAKEAENKKKEIKSKLLILVNDAEEVIGDNFSISAGLVSPSWVEAYERKGYRNFRVNFQKGFENE